MSSATKSLHFCMEVEYMAFQLAIFIVRYDPNNCGESTKNSSKLLLDEDLNMLNDNIDQIFLNPENFRVSTFIMNHAFHYYFKKYIESRIIGFTVQYSRSTLSPVLQAFGKVPKMSRSLCLELSKDYSFGCNGFTEKSIVLIDNNDQQQDEYSFEDQLKFSRYEI